MSKSQNFNLDEKMSKFEELCERRLQAVQENLDQVKADDIEMSVNPHTKVRLERKKEKAEKVLLKQSTRVEGKTSDLKRSLDLTYSIEESEEWNERMIMKTQKTDAGFTDYTQMGARKYEKQTARLDKVKLDNLSPNEVKEKLAEEIIKEQKDRLKLGRRRQFDQNEEDITFINERNYHFNRKADRAYGEYTKNIRNDLEKGPNA